MTHLTPTHRARSLPYSELRAIHEGRVSVDRIARMVAETELARREALGRTVTAVAS